MQATDRGLGTTYERFAVYHWLADVARRYQIRSVLEGPGDGMAGIPGLNGLVLGRQGIDVTVILEDVTAIEVARRGWRSQGCLDCVEFLCSPEGRLPATGDRFDLVWNLNRLPFLEPEMLIAEMASLSRRYVALVVPNRWNYGFPARRLYHRRTGEAWPYGDVSVMAPQDTWKLLEAAGLRIVEVRWVDVPWWPDILDPLVWLEAMIPGLDRFLSRRRQNGDGYRWGPDALPYFDSDIYADVHRRMNRLGWIERHWPALLQAPFAHHFAVLAAQEGLHA